MKYATWRLVERDDEVLILDVEPIHIENFTLFARAAAPLERRGPATLPEWQVALAFAAAALGAAPYWIADLLEYAWSRADWPDQLDRAKRATGYSEEMLQNLAEVSRTTKSGAHEASPSIGHSLVVATLPPDDQARWLDLWVPLRRWRRKVNVSIVSDSAGGTMRVIAPFALLAYCLVFSPTSTESLTAQGKPVKQSEFTIESRGAPATLDELFDASTVVVDGVIQGDHPIDEIHPNVDPQKPPVATFAFTLYDVLVREFLKSPFHMPPNTVLRLLLPGGRRDRGSYIEDEFDPRVPTPHAGEEYILFMTLSNSPRGTFYVPALGFGESVFLLDRQKVTPRGGGPVARAYRGQPLAKLLVALRKRGGSVQ